MSLAEEVSKQIKDAREAKGWTQEELAKLCRVRKDQIAKIEQEQDISRVSMALFFKVCQAFSFNILLLDEVLETIAEENINKYIAELGKQVDERELPNVDIGKALDSVIRYTLTNLRIDYSYGKQEYDYRFNIGNKDILLSWKMGNLKNIEYRNNCLSEVKRSFEETHAHEFIVTIPDYPDIVDELNNESDIDNLIFVRINNLGDHLKDILESEKS